MPRDSGGVYTVPPGSTAVANTTIDPVAFNALVADLAADANTPRPAVAGGTGSSSNPSARVAIGAMPAPTIVAGIGQVANVFADQNTTFFAPAGGTWYGRYLRRNKTTNGVIAMGAGLYPGGANILALGANEDCFGDFIRVA